MRLVEISSVGESLALAPSFVRMTTFPLPATCQFPNALAGRFPILLPFLDSPRYSFHLHGTRFSPSEAEEEIKKWVETSHPSSVFEGEAIGRKATN
jgi:hypothetical protein